jgi:hypothetical protein
LDPSKFPAAAGAENIQAIATIIPNIFAILMVTPYSRSIVRDIKSDIKIRNFI